MKSHGYKSSDPGLTRSRKPAWDRGRYCLWRPWQARAFALALALSERGIFSLRDFQVALIGRINSYEKGQCIAGTGDYYTRWIEALEDLLVQKKLLARTAFAS